MSLHDDAVQEMRTPLEPVSFTASFLVIQSNPTNDIAVAHNKLNSVG